MLPISDLPLPAPYFAISTFLLHDCCCIWISPYHYLFNNYMICSFIEKFIFKWKFILYYFKWESLAIYKTMNNIQQYKTLSVWVDVPPQILSSWVSLVGAVYTPTHAFGNAPVMVAVPCSKCFLLDCIFCVYAQRVRLELK